jgi:lysophospholipase L1-like esterase
MPVRITAALWSVIARKGVLFPINHLVLAPLAIWLVLQIAMPDGVGNKRNLAVRLLALGCVAIFGYLSLVLGRRGNARLLPCFVATCIAGEIVMRAVGSFGTGSDLEWREPRPYFMFAGPTNGRVSQPPAQMVGSDADRQMRFNSEGFRIDGEVSLPKPADEIRIFVMGGSTVLFGAPLANAIPGAIETALRDGGLPHARVYNFGVASFVSGQELSLLVHRLADLAPDLVIAYDGGNDLFQPWFYDPRPGYPFNFVAWEEAIGTLSNTGTQSKTVASLARDSALMQALVGATEWSIRNGLEDLRRKVGFAGAPWRRAVVQSYARNIAAMCRIAQANGALFAAYFQPMLPYSKSLDRRQVAISGGDQMIAGLREERGQVPAAVAAQLAAVRAEAGCRFGDLSDFFENAPNTFVDIIHIESQANALIAGRIARELLGWDALRSRARPP